MRNASGLARRMRSHRIKYKARVLLEDELGFGSEVVATGYRAATGV